jgi:hypothetical protein
MADDNNKKATNRIPFSGMDTIKSALQLVRYDIPVMILGKSSIGKSYTLIDVTKKWNIEHQLLYIGSEKSENIEGVPKFTERGDKDSDILEYLQPYWFPNANVITKSVANGRKLFVRFTDSFWDVKEEKAFAPTYVNLLSILNALSYESWSIDDIKGNDDKYTKDVNLIDYQWITMTGGSKARQLNTGKFPLEKHGVAVRKKDGIESEELNSDEYVRDDIKDFCAYLTTVLGYGNYWLILDEIDKVEVHDQDKFAPLLHIVRERTLKNYRMIDINNGKGLGIPLGESFKDGGYANMIEDVNRLLDAKESVLDTRVIAIANETRKIEKMSPALFRRFVQLIAENVMIWREEDIPTKSTLIEDCLRDIKKEMVGAGLESGSLTDGLKFGLIDEINLQWQYDFFPKMLNENDAQGNYFKLNSNSLYDQSVGEGTKWANAAKKSAFNKLLRDNFRVQRTAVDDFDLPQKLYTCLEPQLVKTGLGIGVSKKTKEEDMESVRGILNQKIKDLGGELDQVAFSIAEDLRNSYPKTKDKEIDKLTQLYNWTDEVIQWIKASLFSTENDLVVIDAAKFLVPSLVNVFYTEIAKDENIVVDNIVPITERFQETFYGVFLANPQFTLDCDKKTTEEAFYGGSKIELSSYTDDILKSASPNTLFGTNEYNWVHSASGKITLNQMEDGILSAFPDLIKGLGYIETIQQLMSEDNAGAIKFMQEYFKPKLEEMMEAKKKYKQEQKDLGNTDNSKKANLMAELLGGIITS